MKRKRVLYVGAAFLALLIVLGRIELGLEKAAAAQGPGEAPTFQVDPMWPKLLPTHWVMGSVIGHQGKSRGSSDTENLGGAANIRVDPATNEVYVADGYGNHRIIVFDADTGKYKRHWGAYKNKPDDALRGPQVHRMARGRPGDRGGGGWTAAVVD